MKYLLIFSVFISTAFAKDNLNDFNKKLLENFEKDVKGDNDLSLRKNQGPSRGPASVAPVVIEEEQKFDKNVRQTGHKDW